MSEFYVDYWGSDPYECNDDCWEGYDFETYDEALAFFHTCEEGKDKPCSETQFIVLNHKDLGEIKRKINPSYIPEKDNMKDWVNEMNMHYYMGGGRD